MKVLVILSVLLVGSLCASSIHQQLMNDLFTQWKLTHKKSYRTGQEESHRFNVFTNNYLTILKINQQQKDVELGLNQFADLTSEEFKALHTGYKPRQRTPYDGISFSFNSNAVNWPPVSVDWRGKGVVTPVKNQGSCGSCWAFSAVGALEGLYAIHNKELISFSEQNFVDCVSGQGESEGCNGGWMTDAFDYTADNGVQTGADYPYTARTGKCQFNATKAVKFTNGYYNVTIKSVTAMKYAVAAGPVSVAIQADQAVFQFYKLGVITGLCGDNLNHGVLAVGYDTFTGVEAFIVKNSWGSSWGNQGYVLIGTDGSANKGNGVCGILADAAAPL